MRILYDGESIFVLGYHFISKALWTWLYQAVLRSGPDWIMIFESASRPMRPLKKGKEKCKILCSEEPDAFIEVFYDQKVNEVPIEKS
jgi:hypothetical protein